MAAPIARLAIKAEVRAGRHALSRRMGANARDSRAKFWPKIWPTAPIAADPTAP